jgi:predicted transcriptional regulator
MVEYHPVRVNRRTSKEAIMKSIKRFWRVNRRPPTVREIADQAGVSSTTIYYHVVQLREGGLLANDDKHLIPSDLVITFEET